MFDRDFFKFLYYYIILIIIYNNNYITYNSITYKIEEFNVWGQHTWNLTSQSLIPYHFSGFFPISKQTKIQVESSIHSIILLSDYPPNLLSMDFKLW